MQCCVGTLSPAHFREQRSHEEGMIYWQKHNWYRIKHSLGTSWLLQTSTSGFAPGGKAHRGNHESAATLWLTPSGKSEKPSHSPCFLYISPLFGGTVLQLNISGSRDPAPGSPSTPRAQPMSRPLLLHGHSLLWWPRLLSQEGEGLHTVGCPQHPHKPPSLGGWTCLWGTPNLLYGHSAPGKTLQRSAVFMGAS